jgi:hypothetical protein
MSSYLPPVLILTGLSFGNKWYTTGQIDIKILLGGGVAAGILAAVNNIPGASGVTSGIAWIALVGYILVNPDIINTLANIGSGKG